MNSSRPLFEALAAGIFLGVLFFGGLWWTVRKSLFLAQPAPWFLLSLVVRMGVTLGGFYLVGHGRPEAFVACLLGFGLGRFIVMRTTRRDRSGPREEAGHAP